MFSKNNKRIRSPNQFIYIYIYIGMLYLVESDREIIPDQRESSYVNLEVSTIKITPQ